MVEAVTRSGTSPVGGNGQVSSRAVVESLQDHFMTLLLTELRYQDPMDPMNDREFFTQLAQFTQVKETVSLREATERTYDLLSSQGRAWLFLGAMQALGRECSWSTERGIERGLVEGVGFENGTVYLMSGGSKVPLDRVVWIGGAVND